MNRTHHLGCIPFEELRQMKECASLENLRRDVPFLQTDAQRFAFLLESYCLDLSYLDDGTECGHFALVDAYQDRYAGWTPEKGSQSIYEVFAQELEWLFNPSIRLNKQRSVEFAADEAKKKWRQLVRKNEGYDPAKADAPSIIRQASRL